MKRHSALLALLTVTFALAMSFSLAACGSSQPATSAVAANTDTINIGITEDIDSLDPAHAASAATHEVLFNIYDGLISADVEGNLQPALATEWSVEDGGKTYAFTLRQGVKFHDGTDLTAEDVKYSIERYRDDTIGGTLVSSFNEVDQVEIVDENHVKVVLTKPDTDFLPFFVLGITPAHVSDLESNPVGTGPYKFSSRSPLENVVLEKFDDYWNKEHAAHINKAVFKVIHNTDSLGMDLAGGTIDMVYRLPAAQISQLPKDKFTIYEGTMNLVQALYLNNAVKPFDDVRVRQALAYAIDPQEIMDNVSDGKGVEVGSSMYPAFKKYYLPELNDTYNQNLDKARELLAEAGYPDGFTFTISVSSTHQQHIETAEVLKEELAKIGVTANIQQLEWNTWLSDVYSGHQFEGTVIGLDASTMSPTSLLARFASDSPVNFVSFKSDAYDQTYAKARAATDEAEKTELYKDCERILSNECAAVYIQDLPSFVALNNRFDGYTFYPFYVQDLAAIKPAQ